MDKIQKLLRRLTDKEYELLVTALRNIKLGKTENLAVKKLTGHRHLYRARIRDFRIIFYAKNDVYEVVDVARRDERTYRNY